MLVAARTVVGERAVVELLAHLDRDGQELCGRWRSWPNPPMPSRWCSAMYRSQWPVDERRHLRPPVLEPGPVRPGDVAGRYQDGLAAGDTEAVVGTLPGSGASAAPSARVTPTAAPLSSARSSPGASAQGGGIGLQHCAVTDDGVRCALEYNCVRWGSHDLPPQAGLGVYERGPDGLLAAARVYDDVVPPAGHS